MSECGEAIAVEVRSFPGHVVDSDRRVKSVGEGLFRYVDGPVQVVGARWLCFHALINCIGYVVGPSCVQTGD